MLAPTPTAINPPGNARIRALRVALSDLVITDAIGIDLDVLRELQGDLKRAKRWIDHEIEDLQHDPHREGTA